LKRVGVWILGARGSISAVTIAGHAAMVRGLARVDGLVTERSPFAEAELAPLASLVFGGHEVRAITLPEAAAEILPACGVHGVVERLGDALEQVEREIRPGIARGAGPGISASGARVVDSDLEAIEAVRADLRDFAARHAIERLIVVNLASTEAARTPHASWQSLEALQAAMVAGEGVLPASALYAYAALAEGHGYVNFTPSLGSRIPALEELALRTGAVHVGSDGKTGETLVKSVLGELFARRNLRVLSWFGQNILGNEDGRVLNDPQHKVSKIRSKDQLLPKLLGYAPETHVGIDYVPSLGEWKIAWDHIHFEGFLGGRMTMQFTWNGCDSLLAAPLVLDLVRLVDLALRRGERGVLAALASFFKDPMGTDEQRLVAQDEALLAWLAGG